MTRTCGALRGARWATAALLLAGAASSRGASLSVPDGPVVLGKTESTSVVIQVDESPGAEDLPLQLSVNVGSFTEPVRLGPGRYRALYVPPATRFPQVALVAAWRETGPDARIDFLRFPLLGVSRVPVSARPGARVRVAVASQVFGPVTADASGRAEVTVLVPPGVSQCEVLVKARRGPELARSVPVEVPPYNRLTAALVPHAIVADGKAAARLDVLYDGPEVPAERIRVTPTVGSVTFRHASRGVYTYRYVPPAGAPAASVTFAVTVAGDPTARTAAALSLGAQAPARLVVTPPARPIRVGSGASVAIDVLVLDAAGMALSGVDVEATANGEPLPPATPRGDGHHEVQFTAPATYPPGGLVKIEAVAHHPESFAFGTANLQVEPSSVPRAVVPRFTPSPVPADGRTEARLVLEVRDAAGTPLERAHLIAVASHGSLGKLREVGAGRYEQTYVAPSALPAGDPALRVVDGSGAFERSFPIPLRHDPGRLLGGVTGGYTVSPGVASGLRAGVEAWVPFRLGAVRLGAGAAAGVGTASRTVTDPTGAHRSKITATFVPAALKLGWEAYASRRLSLVAGAGPALAWARFENSLSDDPQVGVGIGWSAFLDAGCAAGPGLLVLGVSYGSTPVRTTDYRVDPGGLSVTAGYRLRIF